MSRRTKRCNWCDQDPNTDCPRQPIEVHIILRGMTEDDVLARIEQLRGFLSWRSQRPVLPEGWTLAGGKPMRGYTTDGSTSVTVHRRDVTPEQYRAESKAWLDKMAAKP